MASSEAEAGSSRNIERNCHQDGDSNIELLPIEDNDSHCDSDHCMEELNFDLNMYIHVQKEKELGSPFGDENTENDSVANEFMTVLNDLDNVLDNTLVSSYNHDLKLKGEYYYDHSKEDNEIPDQSITSMNSILSDFNINTNEYYDLNSDGGNNSESFEDSKSLSNTSDAQSDRKNCNANLGLDCNNFNRNLSARATIANHGNHPNVRCLAHNRKSFDGRCSLSSITLHNNNDVQLVDMRLNTNNECLSNKLPTSNKRLRDSMRNIEPIEMPEQEISSDTIMDNSSPIQDQMTLPVRLFLETSINVGRPLSAPSNVVSTPPDMSNLTPGRQVDVVIGRRALRQQAATSLEVTPEHVISVTRLRRNNEQARRHSRSRERNRRDDSVSRSVSLASSSNSSNNSTICSNIPEENQNNLNNLTSVPEKKASIWPSISFCLSCLSCTLGIYNISRFAIFSMRFGINFMAQFLILSLVFGIPLFVLQLSLGHTLRRTSIDMWYISPIFQGIGIALWISQAVISIYTIVGVSWMFTYLGDSFIMSNDTYKWGPGNFTSLGQSVPMYFNELVIQRSIPENIATQSPLSIYTLGTIKFQVAFNLAVVWLMLFVAHCRGYQSSVKAMFVFLIPALLGMLMILIRLTMSYNDLSGPLFPETIWSDFFINSKSWSAAAQEVFLTWGLLGIASQTIGSDHARQGSKSIFRASAVSIAVTFLILYVGSLVGVTSLAILVNHGHKVFPSSFEDQSSMIFLHSGRLGISNTPVKYMSQYASMLGITTWQPSLDPAQYSGYQPLELLIYLVPAAVASLGAGKLSPFWPVIFYLTMIMFGLSQQLVMWRGVISGIVSMDSEMMKKKETTITLFSCIVGFLIGLPLTTDAGLNILHWLDYVSVGSWCQCSLWSALIVAVFAVRGRPYTGDRVVTSVFPCASRQPPSLVASLLSFTWNVLLPVLLLVVCVVDFKAGKQRQLYIWSAVHDRYTYWWYLSRQVGGTAQLVLLLMVLLTAVIQAYRYLNSNHPDILVRIQNLYRPILTDIDESEHSVTIVSARPESQTPINSSSDTENRGSSAVGGPPPKYSPPPSYSTATGAAAAQLARLRRSFRRGVARLTSSWSDQTATARENETALVTDITDDNFPRRVSRRVRSASVRYSRASSNLLRNVLRRSLQRNAGPSGASQSSRSTEQLLARPDLLADHIFTVSGNMENSPPTDTSV